VKKGPSTNNSGSDRLRSNEENNLSECLALNEFELINQLKLRKARFQTTAASAAKFSKRNISSASERAFLGVLGDFVSCSPSW